jgi:DNA ligase-1
MSAKGKPISSQIPTGIQNFKYKPNAPKNYNTSVDVSGWLMMEKYDGVRVFWDGKHLFIKNAKIKIPVPTNHRFPSIPFEGELWMGYNSRDRCLEFLESSPETHNWNEVKILIFDTPEATDKPYSQRLDFLRRSNSGD